MSLKPWIARLSGGARFIFRLAGRLGVDRFSPQSIFSWIYEALGPEKTLEAMAAKRNPHWLGGPWEYVESGHTISAYENVVDRWDFYRDLVVFKWQKQHWARLQREADEKANSMSDTSGSREAK